MADDAPTQRRIAALVDGAQWYPYPVIRWTGMLAVTAWAAVHLWIVVRLRRHGRRRAPASLTIMDAHGSHVMTNCCDEGSVVRHG